MGAYYAPGTIKLLHALARLLQTFPQAPGSVCLFCTFGGNIKLAPCSPHLPSTPSKGFSSRAIWSSSQLFS